MSTRSPHEALAIVGMAGRFPGKGEDLAGFWQLLSEGGITVSEVPAERWDWRRHFSANPEAPGRCYVRHANFLKGDMRAFDAGFFGISPREAEVMDPQQRLILEVAWEAIEGAGQDLARLAASRTGVYVGAFTLDNLIGRMGGSSRFAAGPHTAVGSTMTILSNRISHAFDLKGPSLSVDTACSSSLVAFHLACQALWNGEIDTALAGGVNVMVRPEYVIAMCKGHFLAPDGRSKSFDAAGNGYGRGEGAGVMILKPLAKAQVDGDRILALVRATGANQDGRTDGITVPNGEAQQSLMAEVLTHAGLAPADIRYVEAHGTGTALGDPIETRAIGSVLGADRDEPLLVGSVKANIGHLEAASGVAGLIKLVLSLQHRQIPPVAGLTNLNPAIDFSGLGIEAPQCLHTLPDNEALRFAINSFGYGGTNAHAILESPPTARALIEEEPVSDWRLLPVSARSDRALEELVASWRGRIGSAPLQALTAGAARRRSHHECRVSFAGRNDQEIASAMDAWLAAPRRADRPVKNPGVVFVYSGMGPQWWGMARQLLTEDAPSKAFAAHFDALFQAEAGWSLLDEMLKDEADSRVTSTVVAQPANFLCQALVTLWLQRRGIVPAAVVGHSVGEISSAWASGMLSLEQAIRVCHHRSRLQARTAGKGGMLAVGLGEMEVRSLIEAYAGKIEIAAINGSAALTLAGDEAALDELAGRLEVRSIFNRRLKVEVAYHSQSMDPILDELASTLANLTPSAPTLPAWSTVSGKPLQKGDFDAAYWLKNVRQPVFFKAAIEDLCAAGYQTFLEVGPHPVVGGNIREILGRLGVDGRVISTLTRGGTDDVQLHTSLGRLYTAGSLPDWRSINGAADPWLDLPRHPWHREVLWTEAETCAQERLGPPPGPLPGALQDAPTPIWERPINTHYLPWVVDHVVDGLVLLPGAAFVDTALAIAQAMIPGEGALAVSNLSLRRPLDLEGDATYLYQAHFDPASSKLGIASREEAAGTWTQHVDARLGRQDWLDSERAPATDALAEQDVTQFYARLAAMGLNYGPAFRRITAIRAGSDLVAAHLAPLADSPADIHHLIHPTQLDGAFQALLAVALNGSDTPWVPTHVDAVVLRRPCAAEALHCVGRVRVREARRIVGDIWLCDAAGELLAVLEGVQCVPARRAKDALFGLLYQEGFEALPALTDSHRLGTWLVLSEDGFARGGKGEALARHLGDSGVARVLSFAIAAEAGAAAIGRIDGPADWHWLLAEYPTQTLAGVAYLASDKGEESVIHARSQRVLSLIQALGAASGPRLYLLTTNAQAAAEGDLVSGHAQATVQGLGRVAHNEYPDLAVSMIDLDDHPASLAAVARELIADDQEDDLALRQGERWGRRVHPVTPADLRAPALQASVAAPEQVVLDGDGPGDAYWRARALPAPHAGEVRLCVHRLIVADTSTEPPLCGFVARVESGQAQLGSEWIAAALPFQPRSHLSVEAAGLLSIPLDGPHAGAENLLHLWAGIHHSLSGLIAQTGQDSLLLFGTESPEGQAVRAIAPLLGIRRIICADAFRPEARGLHQRLLDANEGQSFGLVVVTRAGYSQSQALPLARQAHVLCLGEARGLELGAWAAGCTALSQHRGSPLEMLKTAPELLVESCRALAAALAEERLALVTPATLDAEQWVRNGAPARHSVALQPLPTAVPEEAGCWRPDGRWVISGGLGGFGLACAEWLCAHGVTELTLLGRSPAQGDAARRVARMQADGAQVDCVQLDIADPAQVDTLVAGLAAHGQALGGILHAAGVLGDTRIDEMDANTLSRVLAPKVDGAWNLHQALENHGVQPRHFILFSSVAATVGNTRQANYVAANVQLDALAAWRRARGQPADCVAWGALGFGMGVSNEALGEHFKAMGMRPLSHDEALAGLQRVLAERPGAVVIADMDFPQWGRFEPHGGSSPRFAHLTGKGEGGTDSALKSELATLDAGERLQIAGMMLAEAFAGPLKMSAEKVDPERPLADLGVDSLMAVEIQLAIAQVFAVEFSTLELMRGNTITSLAGRVLERMGIASGETSATPAPAA